MRLAYSALLGNRTSAIGVALTTASALIFFFLMVLDLAGFLQNPYMGIVLFVLLPGLVRDRVASDSIGSMVAPPSGSAAAEPKWPKLDLADPSMRRALLFFAVATLANIGILSTATFGAVHYSESQAFCGQACHEPMTPSSRDTEPARTRMSGACRATWVLASAATSGARSLASVSCTCSRAGPSTGRFRRPFTTSRPWPARASSVTGPIARSGTR